MKITTLGINIAKRSFHLLEAGTYGQVVLRGKLMRKRLARFIANLPPCKIGMLRAMWRELETGSRITLAAHEG